MRAHDHGHGHGSPLHSEVEADGEAIGDVLSFGVGVALSPIPMTDDGCATAHPDEPEGERT
jgi:hypothetical protein